MLLLAHGKHGMELQSRRDPGHDQAAIIRGDANLAKRKILGNRIIRAIPGAVGERGKRCFPYFCNPVVIVMFFIGRIARLIARLI